MKKVALTFAACFLAANAWSAGAERAWQTGTWRSVEVVRPKVVFGIGRSPSGGIPGVTSAPAMRETRIYVIETRDLRLELKESATADSRRIDAMVEEPVTFALEKNTVYIKDAEGVEHKLNVTRKTPRTKP